MHTSKQWKSLVFALLLIATIPTHSQTRDTRVILGDDSAQVRGADASALTLRGRYATHSAPVIIARYAPVAGTYAGLIEVVFPHRASSTFTATRFAPADGARWAAASSHTGNYGGVNPFSVFENASMVTTFGAGVWSNLTLPEFLVAVGHAYRLHRAQSALVAVAAVEDTSWRGEQSAMVRAAAALSREFGAAQSAHGGGRQGSFVTHWYWGSSASTAMPQAFTTHYVVPSCNPTLSPRDRCVARSGLAFVQVHGSLPNTATSVGTVSGALPGVATASDLGSSATAINFLSAVGAEHQVSVTSLLGSTNPNAASRQLGVTNQAGAVNVDAIEEWTVETLSTADRLMAASAFDRSNFLSASSLSDTTYANLYGFLVAPSIALGQVNSRVSARTHARSGTVASRTDTQIGEFAPNEIDGTAAARRNIR